MALEVDIQKKYPGFTLDVAWKSDHNCMGLLGASGSGKSVTLKCIAGIEKPDTGRIVLDGRVLFDSKKRINLKPQERNIGYLFQNYALFPTMTVRENLKVVLKKDCNDPEEKVKQQIEKFRLDGLEEKRPNQLSGGQQQRVALARMMIMNPKMILLDEPFSALDAYLRDIMQQYMQEVIHEFPGEVLLVSHSRDEIYKLSNRMTLLDEGKNFLTGDTKEIFKEPIYQKAALLTGCKNISPAEKCGEHEIFAKDWNLKFKTDKSIGDDVKYIGIRAHYVQPVDELQGENTYAMQLVGEVEAPFEYHYLLKPEGASKPIWWLVTKNKKASDTGYYHIPKEALLLLK